MTPQYHHSKERRYFIDVHKWRSVVALVACLLTYVLSIICIAQSVVWYTEERIYLGVHFRYFTTLSNMVTGLASGFIIPFAFNGIRKKRFIYPKWLSLLHYAGTIGITLTLTFSLLVILPYDREFAIGGNHLYLHVVCPLAVIVSFMLVESERELSFKDMLKCLIPTYTYTIVYFVMVVIVGEENGGWEDMYKLNTFISGYISLPLVWILAFLIAFVLRHIYNWLVRIRTRKLMKLLSDNLKPVQVNLEVYGLGRYYGLIGDKAELCVPYDILETIARRYNLDVAQLVKIYTKGLVDGITDTDGSAN